MLIALLTSTSDDHHYIGGNSMSDKVLRTIEHPLFSLLYSSGKHTARIRACIVLGNSPCPNMLTRGQFGEPTLFLLFRSKGKKMIYT